ncbi:MAG: 2OG-Fe(II) oxygenase [Cyanophyceae cyanobacterium]
MTQENLSGLINNTIPLIRIPNFGTTEEAEELAERFLQFAARSNSVKTVTRLGISQYEQGTVGGKINYFRLVEGAWSNLIKVCETTFNPTLKVMEILREYFTEVDILTEEGYGRYFAGVAKLRTGKTPIHSDFPLLGALDWAIAEMVAQLSWNFYLRVPNTGGELRIWDRLWQEEDDQLLVKGTYYHDEKIISNIPSITVKPVLGELIIFNSQNYHTVLPAQNRIAVGSWISLMPDRSLKLWS